MSDWDVLSVDEPSAGLDPEERLRFRHLLSELGFRKLVIVSTHIVSDVENMAGHLAIMRAGKLVAYDTPDTLVRQARGISLRNAHPYAPCGGALESEASLEEALMAQRYSLQGEAA